MENLIMENLIINEAYRKENMLLTLQQKDEHKILHWCNQKCFLC